MRRKLTVLAVLAVAVIASATVAAANSVPAKQRVQIDMTAGSSVFTLTPLAKGAIKKDSGTASFCCWGSRWTYHDGQAVQINNPKMTLTGAHGTIVARNEIGWVDLPGGDSLFTGTWKVIAATGVYAGVTGGGGAGGLDLASGGQSARFQGFLTK